MYLDEFDEILIDELKGERFGPEDQLEVLGWSGRNRHHKNYLLKCHICCNDPEMFGDGIFCAVRFNLERGRIPCFCSPCFRYSEDQLKITIRRKLEGSSLVFLGWNGEFRGSRGDVLLECACGYKFNRSVKVVLKDGHTCKSCFKGKLSSIKSKGVEEHISDFMMTGNFVKGTKFELLKRNQWNVTCPVCTETNIASGHSMKNGFVPCHCGTSLKRSKSQWLSFTTDLCNTRGYIFKGFVDKIGVKDRIVVECLEHGEWTPMLDSFKQGRGCPLCSGRNLKQAYINLILEDDKPVAIKFGVAIDSSKRLDRLKTNNRGLDFQTLHVYTFQNRKLCLSAESECKRLLSTCVMDKTIMSDGYTETTYLYNVEKIVKIYEQFGGEKYP